MGIFSKLPFFITTIGVVTVGIATADDEKVTDLPAPERAIVVSAVTKVMQGDEAKSNLAPGQLVTLTKAKGGWRYTPDFRGWINYHDVVTLDKSVDYFSRIIQDKPSAAAFHHRAIAHIALEEFELALQDLDQAIVQGDKSTYVYVNRGIAYRETGEPEKAIKDFTQAVTLNPSNTQAILLRGMLLLELGHPEAALKDFDQAIAVSPKSAEAHNQRGVALRLAGKSQEAFECFQKAIEFAPEFADAYANRAFASCSLGEFGNAVKDYEQALKLVPNQPEFLNDYAWLLATCSDTSVLNADLAVQHSKQACELLPEPDPSFLDTLAAAHARKGDFDTAVEVATQAIDLMENDPGVGNVDARRQLYREKKAYTETEIK